MDIHDVFALTAYLHRLYEDKFPELNPDMTRIWYEELRNVDADVAHQAVRSWVRRHTLKAPDIDGLLEIIENIQADQRQARRSGSSDKSYGDVLHDAGTAQASNGELSEDDQTFHILMSRIAQRQLGPWIDAGGKLRRKLTCGEMAEQCAGLAEEYAAQRPLVADLFRHTARQYGHLHTEEEIDKLPVTTTAPEPQDRQE